MSVSVGEPHNHPTTPTHISIQSIQLYNRTPVSIVSSVSLWVWGGTFLCSFAQAIDSFAQLPRSLRISLRELSTMKVALFVALVALVAVPAFAAYSCTCKNGMCTNVVRYAERTDERARARLWFELRS